MKLTKQNWKILKLVTQAQANQLNLQLTMWLVNKHFQGLCLQLLKQAQKQQLKIPM